MAILAGLFRGPVTIVPDDEFLGRTRYRLESVFLRAARPTSDCVDGDLAAALRRRAMIKLAPYVGCEELDEVIEDIYWDEDWGDERSHCTEIHDLAVKHSYEAPRALLEDAVRAVAFLFSRPPIGRALESLTEALLERGTLEFKEVFMVVWAAMGRAQERWSAMLSRMADDDRRCATCGAPLWYAPGRRYCYGYRGRSWCRPGREQSAGVAQNPGRPDDEVDATVEHEPAATS